MCAIHRYVIVTELYMYICMYMKIVALNFTVVLFFCVIYSFINELCKIESRGKVINEEIVYIKNLDK